MRTTLLSVVGVVMVVLGAVLTAQGLGYLKGSPMTGQESWAIIGPLLAGLGVALVWTAISAARR